MTLMKAGAALFLAGIALIRFGSPTELQAINEALTRRFKTGIALALGGIVLSLVGARLQGQIVFRRLKRRYQPQIDQVRRRFSRLRPVVKAIPGRTEETDSTTSDR